MKKKIDKKFKSIIIKIIESQFIIKNGELFNILDKTIEYPQHLSAFLVEMFDISKNIADFITHTWLFENEYTEINEKWSFGNLNENFHDVNAIFNGGNLILGGYGIGFGQYNTMTGLENIAIGDNTIAIGHNNNRIYTSHTIGIDATTTTMMQSTNATVIQMSSDGTYSFI